MWKEILKGRGLIDPEKLKNAMDLDKKPQFGDLKRIPKGDGEYANVTANRLLDIEFEKRAIRVKGDITVDGKTIPFSASVGLPKPLAAMSKLPYNFRQFYVDFMELRNNMPKEFLSEENDNFQDGIERYIEEELAYFFNLYFRYFEEDMAYGNKDFFRTSEGLSSRREDYYGNVAYDKRSKQQSFKDVLRKPDSSNVREFNEIMSNTRDYVKALPVTKLQALIKRGIVKEIENPKEEHKYQVVKRNLMMDGIPIHLFFEEALLSGGEEYVFEVTDDQGTYDMNLYAGFNFDDVSMSNITSKERQKLIDNAKKFMKMSPESMIEAILRS